MVIVAVAGDKRTWCGSIKSLIYFIFTILFWLLITTCVDQILTPYWSMTAQGVSCDIVYEPVPPPPSCPSTTGGILSPVTTGAHLQIELLFL